MALYNKIAGQDKAASIGMISAERMLALALRAGSAREELPRSALSLQFRGHSWFALKGLIGLIV